MNVFAGVRLGLYCWCFFSFLITWVVAAAFIGRTESDFGIYAPSAVVILVAGLLGNTILPVCITIAFMRAKTWPYGALALEFISVFIVWGLMLGGAAALSNRYPNYGWCFGGICSLARSVQAWSWISWISTSFLLVMVGLAGCIGPDEDHERAGTNREVVGNTEMGLTPQQSGMSGQQTGVAQHNEPKGPMMTGAATSTAGPVAGTQPAATVKA